MQSLIGWFTYLFSDWMKILAIEPIAGRLVWSNKLVYSGDILRLVYIWYSNVYLCIDMSMFLPWFSHSIFLAIQYTIQYTVDENNIVAPKLLIFQYCNSNTLLFSIATCKVITPILIRFIFSISSLLLLLMTYYSYRSSNYYNSNSCRSFLLLKAIAKRKTHRFLL